MNMLTDKKSGSTSNSVMRVMVEKGNKMDQKHGQSSGGLRAINSQLWHENQALRQRIADLQATDTEVLRQEVEQLRKENERLTAELQKQRAAFTLIQGLVFFLGIGFLMLCGEPLLAILERKSRDADEQREHYRKEFGDMAGRILAAIKELDLMSQETLEALRKHIENRVNTLPRFKRAVFLALNDLGTPSEIGSRFFRLMSEFTGIQEKLSAEDWEKYKKIGEVLDNVSHLWPLAAVNTLGSLIRYAGIDEAAEAAGEILDSLEQNGEVPRNLVHRIKPDLVAMEAVDASVKPSTIIGFIKDGFKLTQLGIPADEAIAQGQINSSLSQLKRASRVYKALETLYDKVSDNVDLDLSYLDAIGSLLRKAVENARSEQAKLTA